MLEIKNLHATVDGKPILNGIDLTIEAGEVHAMMGPNGSGKSTLSYVLAGREGYEATDGAVLFKGKNLLEMAPEERAGEGVFLAFQYPVEIPGVPNTTFLKEALNSVRRSEEHTSELQSLMRISYAVFCLKKQNKKYKKHISLRYTNNYPIIDD